MLTCVQMRTIKKNFAKMEECKLYANEDGKNKKKTNLKQGRALV